MTHNLMLVYTLLVAAMAGSTGVWWTIFFFLPFFLAWAWLKGTDNGITNN